jgi:Protein of unknown function (DUF3093)
VRVEQQAPVALFRERLWPSPGVWLLVPVGGLVVLVALLPVGAVTALVGTIAVTAGLLAWAITSAPVISVRDGTLWAGRARVPVEVLGEAVAARGAMARDERGRKLDARAFLLIRGWVDPVVRVELRDSADPTPYWLLSTRRPDELLRALEEARSSSS